MVTAGGGPTQGSIIGTVTSDGSRFEDVFVEAVGTGIYDTTDVNGVYALNELDAGSHDVHFSHVSFGDTTITGIDVPAGGTITVDLAITSGGPGCDYTIGDINDSGSLNGLDVTYGVAYFKGGNEPPYSCECTPGNTWFVSSDVNGSCSFNGLDITYLVSYFKGGNPPVQCDDCPPVI